MATERDVRPRDAEAEKRLMQKLRAKLADAGLLTDGEPEGDEPTTTENVDVIADTDETGTSAEGDETDIATGRGGGGGGGGGGGTSSTTVIEAVEGGTQQATPRRRRRRQQGLPTPQWIPADQWEDEFGYDPQRFAVVVRSADDTIIRYNEGWGTYLRHIAWFTTQWIPKHRSVRMRRIPSAVLIAEMQEQYHLDTAARYVCSLSEDPGFTEDLKRADSGEGPCLLTTGARGFVNVEAAVMVGLGSRQSTLAAAS
jgi:hypothetical protein